MRSLRVLLILACVSAPGCYAYIPSSPQEVQPGQSVRVRLRSQDAAAFQDLRLNNPRLLEGTLVETGPEQLVVEAQVGGGGSQTGSRILVQQVNVPLASALDVEIKELDRMKTGLLVGGGGALLAIVIARSAGGSGSEDPGQVDVPEARRIPLIRFALPFGR